MTHGNMNVTLSAPIAFVAELREFAEAERMKISGVLRAAFHEYKRIKRAGEPTREAA
jgi:hypothetical protein